MGLAQPAHPSSREHLGLTHDRERFGLRKLCKR
jgi:hypothetical protein